MACVRKRRGLYVVDYRDAAGVRRNPSFDTRREAEEELARIVRERQQATAPTVDPNIRARAYAALFLAALDASVRAGTLKQTTREHYERVLDHHVHPTLGSRRVRDLTRGRLKALLLQKLADGLAPGTVSIIHRTLRAMLSAAVDDGVLLANPASRLGRTLRLVPAKATRQEDIKAMTREQLATFLGVATVDEPRTYPLLLLLARTGLRIGEALALQWEDVDLHGHTLRVARSLADNGQRVDTPKSGHGRDVDLSQQLAATLRGVDAARKARALRKGIARPPWVFPSERGETLDPHNVRRAFRRILERAKLPPHFTPHCLRHTFASLLLADGKPIVYVQRQLGHASITLTVDTYGKWLPMADKGAVDSLDDTAANRDGGRMVANGSFEARDRRSTPRRRGESGARAAGYEVGRVGLEPTTRCLKGTCSTT